MRRMIATVVAFAFLLGSALVSHAGDEVATIVDKAIIAHGLKGKVDKGGAFRGKNKGTLHVAGMELEFTQDVSVQFPNKFKEVMEMTVMGQKVNVTTVYNGKQAWIKANETEIKVEKEVLEEFKEAAYAMNLAQGLFLKDKSLKLSSLGEVQVKGKPALGIRVTKDGQKDLSFYFDKTTGLTAKVERRTRDFMSGQEVLDERIITEYQEVGGHKVAKKVEVLRDGKAFLVAEVVDVQFFDKLDDSEFAKPQ